MQARAWDSGAETEQDHELPSQSCSFDKAGSGTAPGVVRAGALVRAGSVRRRLNSGSSGVARRCRQFTIAVRRGASAASGVLLLY